MRAPVSTYPEPAIRRGPPAGIQAPNPPPNPRRPDGLLAPTNAGDAPATSAPLRKGQKPGVLAGHIQVAADHDQARCRAQPERRDQASPQHRPFHRQEYPRQPINGQRRGIALPENEGAGEWIAPRAYHCRPEPEVERPAKEEVGPQSGDEGGRQLRPGQHHRGWGAAFQQQKGRELWPDAGSPGELIRHP